MIVLLLSSGQGVRPHLRPAGGGEGPGPGRAEDPDLPLQPVGRHGLYAGQVPPDRWHGRSLQQEEGSGLADRDGHEAAEGGPTPGQGQWSPSPAAGPHYGVETRTGQLSTGQRPGAAAAAGVHHKEISQAPSTSQTEHAVQQGKVCWHGVLDCGLGPSLVARTVKKIDNLNWRFWSKEQSISRFHFPSD